MRQAGTESNRKIVSTGTSFTFSDKTQFSIFNGDDLYLVD